MKAQNIKNEEEDDCNEEELDEEMSLFVKRFNRFMNKKSFGKRAIIKKILLLTKKYFECGELGHIIINCPNYKNDKDKKYKKCDERKKKKFIKKRRNGQVYFC